MIESKEQVGDKNDSYTLLSLTTNGVIIRDVSEGKGKFPKDFKTYKVVKPGNLIFCLFDVDETPRTIGHAHHQRMITGAYNVFSVKDVNVDFLCYYFISLDDRKALKPLYKGLRKVIPLPTLMSMQIYLPPLAEQEAIVAYLEEKVTQMDNLVAKQEAQIAYLQELKQAIIARAVTQGLDPQAPLRPSGISWIGNIPEHWEVKRAKNMFVRKTREVREFDEIITCFRDGTVTLRTNRRTEGFTESFKETGYQGIRKGDLVIHQMDAFAGAIGVSDSDGKGTPVYICLQPLGDCFNEYYSYLLREMARAGYIKSLYRGIRERSSDFRYETFARLSLPLPPLSEQEAIVTYVNRKTEEIDHLIAMTEQEIARVRELKQALIADVVTGRISVQPS